jgi:hypothetical protein
MTMRTKDINHHPNMPRSMHKNKLKRTTMKRKRMTMTRRVPMMYAFPFNQFV